MAIGIILGNFVPNTGLALQKGKFVGISVPIAVGLLVMRSPIFCKDKFETLYHVFKQRTLWILVGFSVFVIWVIAPRLILALAWAYLPHKPGLREGKGSSSCV